MVVYFNILLFFSYLKNNLINVSNYLDTFDLQNCHVSLVKTMQRDTYKNFGELHLLFVILVDYFYIELSHTVINIH